MTAEQRDSALLDLLRFLADRQYQFTTPSPLTHSRILARADRRMGSSLSDIFGWNIPFTRDAAGETLLSLMAAAGVLGADAGALRSMIRVSTLDGALFAHSAYPTSGGDAVFFGPDTYRFASFIKSHLQPLPLRADLRCADIGCGSGAGAIIAALLLASSNWTLSDINPAALRLAAINAELAGCTVETVLSDVLAAVAGTFDLIICNPPYLTDARQRIYRHGGGLLGRELSLRIVAEACLRLNPGGRLLMYTGVAIVNGRDPLLADLKDFLGRDSWHWRYAEIDPDVFGEELEQAAYADADRIAVVGLVVDKR